MGKARQIAKKALAVISAAALLATCGAAGSFAGFARTDLTVSAASAVATQLKVYDENNNDLGDNPIIYLDTSEAGGSNADYGNVTKSIKVVANNDNGVAVNDEIRFFSEVDADQHVMISCPESGVGNLTASISGGYYERDGEGKMNWVEKAPGTTRLYFTTTSGEVFRTVTIVVYRPAHDMFVSIGNHLLSLNENNLSNSTTTMVIANHKYQFTATEDPSD